MRSAHVFVVLTVAPSAAALGAALSRGATSAAAGAWTTVAGAVAHALEPRDMLQSSSLEELTNVRIDGPDSELLAHVALPDTPPEGAPLPVLILIHEFFGLNEGIIAKANLFANELDALVIAPDTFRGVSTTFIPRAIWLALSTPQERVNRDLDAWLSWASSPECARVAGVLADTKRVAVLGFCYGGGKAIRYTTQSRTDAATVLWCNACSDAQTLWSLCVCSLAL